MEVFLFEGRLHIWTYTQQRDNRYSENPVGLVWGLSINVFGNKGVVGFREFRGRCEFRGANQRECELPEL